MNKIFHHPTTNLGLIALSICGAIAISVPLDVTVNPVFAQGERDNKVIISPNNDNYFSLSQYNINQLKKIFEQQLREAEQSGDLRTEAIALLNLANVYISLSEFGEEKADQDAVKLLKKSLKIRQQLGDDLEGEALTLFNLGALYIRMGQWDNSIKYFAETIKLAKTIKDISLEGNALARMGLAYHYKGDAKTAINCLNQGIKLLEKTSDIQLLMVAVNNLGLAQFESGKLAEATTTLYKALDIWEKWREIITNNDQTKIIFGEIQLSPIHRLLQRVLIAQNKFVAALEISEQSRGRALFELLNNNNYSSIANIQTLRNIAKNQKATLVEYAIAYEEYREKGLIKSRNSELYIWVISPNGNIEFRSVNLRAKNIKIAQLIPQMRKDIGVRGNQGKFPYKVGDKVRLKKDFNDNGTLKKIGTSEPWIIVSVNEKTGFIEVKKPHWSNPKDTKTVAIEEVKIGGDISTYLQTLHQILIDPIADLLPKDAQEKVIFIPQGQLLSVPFPALKDANNQYLIDKHTILTAPSILILDSTHKLSQKPANKVEKILIVGNPSPMPEKWTPLKYAETEARKLADFFQTQAILGNKATESNIIKQLPQAKIIHLATHGTFADQNGLDSYIVLGMNDPKNPDEDGKLTAAEIFNYFQNNNKLSAELAVLSACETGRGEITGDGVIGLSRSLISAVVPSVIVSLWKVDDQITSDLMLEFYQQWKITGNKAIGLRNAMLKIKKQNSNPYYWAAFTLIGEAE
jgi:CHAT domain-containing protein/tetratricopeptide (TPR) repeat protein